MQLNTHISDPMKLSINEIDVWYANAWTFSNKFHNYFYALSSEEKSHCLAFKFKEHQINYCVAHGILRSVLSRYLNCLPHEIKYQYSQNGKPEIKHPSRKKNIYFNLSYSNEWIIIAIRQSNPVGIDIESYLKNIPFNPLEIAKNSFHPKELEELSFTSPQQLNNAFYRLWTQKEAYLKACGLGLSVELNQFRVTISGNPKILEPHKLQPQNVEWFCEHFELTGKFVACICSPNPVDKTNYYLYTPH